MKLKTVGYLLFAGMFWLASRFTAIDKKKVFCIMTHDAGADSSVGVVVGYLQKEAPDYHFCYLKERSAGLASGIRLRRLKSLFSFFVAAPCRLAASAYILQDNIFLPMAYLKFKKEVKVVQLWHGTGTIKKFGQSINTGKLKELEKRANRTITHLIVNSEYTKKQYREAFGVPMEKVYVLGLPRTDIMLDQEKKEEDLREFYQEYPELAGKKIILYVPTFRDAQVKQPRMELCTDTFLKELPEDYILAYRLHPFVAAAFAETKKRERIYNFSRYRDLNTLLFASDTLITDYSSVIFEYCLLGKPMIFYAYDLEEFSNHGRGFYENYRAYVPGPVAESTEGVIEIIRQKKYNIGKIEEFRRNSYEFLDGESRKRLFNEIFSNFD